MCDQGALPCLPHSLPQSTQAACRHEGCNPSLRTCSVWPSFVLPGCDFLLRGQSRSQVRAATADRRVVSSPRTGGAVSESRGVISGSFSQAGRLRSSDVSRSVSPVLPPPDPRPACLSTDICSYLHITVSSRVPWACVGSLSTQGNQASAHNHPSH